MGTGASIWVGSGGPAFVKISFLNGSDAAFRGDWGAAGFAGSGAAYLHFTVMKLEELGIHDTYLWELQHLVAAEIRQLSGE